MGLPTGLNDIFPTATALTGRTARRTVLAGLLAGISALAAAPAEARVSERNTPVPVLRPEPPAPLTLTRRDVERLEDILTTARRRGWDEAWSDVPKVADPVARKLLTWMRVQSPDSGATFGEIISFIDANPGWPNQTRLWWRAEEALPAGMVPSDVLNWFAGRHPVSADGLVKLAEAHEAVGDERQARDLVREAWVRTDLSYDAEDLIAERFTRYLRPSDHETRLDRLVWDGRRGATRRMHRYVSTDLRKLATARLALRFGRRGVDRMIDRVPRDLANDAGLLYERVRWRRKRDRDSETWDLLLQAPGDPDRMGDPDRWWLERRIQARHALSAGRYREAYRFVSNHGLSSGADFADAEWLSGWIALQYLDDPKSAYRHFTTLTENVSYPISKARGLYWMGRAAEKLNDPVKVREHYTDAAGHSTTSYGQLAIERIGAEGGILRLTGTPEPTTEERQAFLRTELAQAVITAADFAPEWVIRTLIMHMAEKAQTTKDFALIADFARALDYRHYSVRVAKEASQAYKPINGYNYPLVDLPDFLGRGREPERALVLALIRQESEFNSSARSHAAANGLMQIVAGTARMTAQQHDMVFRSSWLRSRPDYNSQIGRAHLADLLEEYDGSYILATAAYNAGPARVDDWLEEFGDPREAGVDAVDWIERIPFSETRNYVQRIMETVTVYRNLLSGQDHKVALSEDLKRTTARAPRLTAVAPAAPRRITALPLTQDKRPDWFHAMAGAPATPSAHGHARSDEAEQRLRAVVRQQTEEGTAAPAPEATPRPDSAPVQDRGTNAGQAVPVAPILRSIPRNMPAAPTLPADTLDTQVEASLSGPVPAPVPSPRMQLAQLGRMSARFPVLYRTDAGMTPPAPVPHPADANEGSGHFANESVTDEPALLLHLRRAWGEGPDGTKPDLRLE